MRTRIVGVAGALALALAGRAFAGSGTEDVTKHPGYVDFGPLNVFGNKDKDVEIILEQGMLGFVSVAARNGDPDLADMLSKLMQIRVQTFAIQPDKLEAIEAKTQEVVQKLEAQGWSTMIKVRDRKEGSQTYVYSKLVDGKMQGLVVMNVDPKDDASFVNIVGEIDPDQLGKLQSKFDVKGLDSLNIQIKDQITDDKEKEREKAKHK